MTHELELEVFRAGDYGAKGRWSEDELDRIAEDYDAALHEAPVTLDHAQSGPALGWVAGVRRAGDRLVAHLRDLHEDFLAQLRKGTFKKRSVEIYRALPETGRPYLKAVSFLGAAAPAVKGLRDVLFDEALPAMQFDVDPADWSDPTDTSELSDVIPDVSVRFEELRAELRRDGRWIPAWESQGLKEFITALAAFDEIPIGKEESVDPVEWFAQFLRSLPAYLPMGEAAPAAQRAGGNSIPKGAPVSAGSIELHRRVTAMREAHPKLSYSAALRECARERSA